MPFVNDPQFDDLSPVGSGEPMLVAARTRCGEAFRWEPGGDAEALVSFVGAELVAVQGQVYRRYPDSSLVPFSALLSSLVVVKPPAGEVLWLTPAEFAQQFAQVVVVAAPPDAGASSTSDVAEEGDRAVSSPVADAASAPRKKPGPKPKPKE